MTDAKPEPENGGKAMPNSGGVTFSREVNLGTMAQILVILVTAVGWFATQAGRNDANQTALANTRIEMQQGFARMETQQQDSLRRAETAMQALVTQIANLPNLGARSVEMERRITGTESRLDAHDVRLGRVGEELAGLRAEITALSRATNVPLMQVRPR